MKNSIWKRFKNYFIAGLFAILPFWATFIILITVFKLIASVTKPYLVPVPYLADFPFLLDLVSFFGTILFVVILGILFTNVLGRRVFLGIDKALQRIPVLSWVYSSIRRLTTIVHQEGGASEKFKRVVMFEYPRKNMFVIGFVTAEAMDEFNTKANKKLVNVFLPTTPNPTSGFLLLIPQDEIIPLDLSPEDAVKLIVSAGIAVPQKDES